MAEGTSRCAGSGRAQEVSLPPHCSETLVPQLGCLFLAHVRVISDSGRLGVKQISRTASGRRSCGGYAAVAGCVRAGRAGGAPSVCGSWHNSPAPGFKRVTCLEWVSCWGQGLGRVSGAVDPWLLSVRNEFQVVEAGCSFRRWWFTARSDLSAWDGLGEGRRIHFIFMFFWNTVSWKTYKTL